MKTSRVSRVVQLLTTLQSGENYDTDDLAKMLGTSRRTVFRDLKELQAVGVPYHYNAKSGSYTIDPEFFLPPIDLNLPGRLACSCWSIRQAVKYNCRLRNQHCWPP